MVRQDFLSPPSGVKCVKKWEDIMRAKEFDCDRESGFGWTIIRAPPDANEITSMCQSAKCRDMLTSMQAVAPTECVTASGWYLYADLLNPILKGCESVPAPSTGEPPYNGTASTTAKPTAIVTAPTTATTIPAATVSPVTAPVAAVPIVAPAVVTLAPPATTAVPVADTSTKIVDSALSRGTIIAILSASVVVLTTITGLVKWWYNRRQDKKAAANGATSNQSTNNGNSGKGRRERGQGEGHNFFAHDYNRMDE